MMKKVATAVVLFLLYATESIAQFRFNEIQFAAGPSYTISNHPDFPEVKEVSFLASMRLSGQLEGSRPWHRSYGYPLVGINAAWATLGNSGVLGNYYGLMADIIFPKNLGNGNALELEAGMGASYFSKPYDQVENPGNVVIGSSFTFSAYAALAFVKRISDRSSLSLTANVVHCSNSHFKLPNVGLNMPGILAGYRYSFRSAPFIKRDSTDLVFDRRWRPVVRLALGFNEQGSSTGPVNGPKYPIYLGGVYAAKKVSYVNRVSVGLEYYFNTGIKDYIISQDFYDDKVNKRSSVVSLMFGHEFLMGHIGVLTNLGVNIYSKFHQDRLKREEIDSLKEKIKAYVPARLGFQYYFRDPTVHHSGNFFVGIYIKSNFGQADFLETGLGYTI